MEPQVFLIVDDSPEDREITHRALRRLGVKCEVVFAATGDEAIALLEGTGQHPQNKERRPLTPAAVLLDLHLPGTDGVAVLSHIRRSARLAHVPVVLISSTTDRRQIARGFEAGASGFVRKRFQYESFEEDLSGVLARALAGPGRAPPAAVPSNLATAVPGRGVPPPPNEPDRTPGRMARMETTSARAAVPRRIKR